MVLECPQQKKWMRHLCLFCKVVSTKIPAYIYDLIHPVKQSQRHINILLNSFSCRTEYLKNSFFPCVIAKRNKLNPGICSSGSYNTSRKSLLNIIRPSTSKVYNINDTIAIKLITRLRLRFSHLREHRFKHNFQNTLNLLCSCNTEAESTPTTF